MSMSCDDQQAAYLEGVGSADEHVRSCPTCGAIIDELDDIREAMTDPAMWAEPDPNLENRVVAAVERAEMEEAAPVVSLTERRRLRDRFRVSLPAVATIAACLLIGAVVGAGVMRAADRSSSPDHQVALAATPLAPDASGDADVRTEANGVEIRLHLSGLPRTPAGFYYQAWLKGDKGLVPIGTFHTGDGEVVLWSGVPVDEYHTITVTVEEENGDQASSGKRVLTGELKKK
jgi:anti-sigma-K factor RskA